MTSDLINLNGRTPEEERQYRIENRLPLREVPMTEEERKQAIAMILERDRELLQILADA